MSADSYNKIIMSELYDFYVDFSRLKRINSINMM